MELVLEQSQQGSSHEVSVSTEGVEELKRIANVSKSETQQKNQPEIKKSKNVGPRESLATPKSRKPRFLLRWSPTSKMFDSVGKLVAPSGDNACNSNTVEPKIKRFPNSTSLLGRLQNFDIQFLKEACNFVGDFKSLTNKADASLAKYKELKLEIKRLLKAIVSQDIMLIVQNESVVDTSDLQTELERTHLSCTDADYAGCKDTFKSTSGGAQLLGEKLVSWSSKK
nr:retrotransposon protein, putative, unclassified [Tanacetum cinerariifolium]